MAPPKSIQDQIGLISEIFSKIELLEEPRSHHTHQHAADGGVAEHFCELDDTAEKCGMSEVSYHLRKAKLAWMSAFGGRETKQTCMRDIVRLTGRKECVCFLHLRRFVARAMFS